MNAPPDPPVSRRALVVMIAIVVTIALVALYAGVQRLRRAQIEQVVITPVSAATPSPTPQ